MSKGEMIRAKRGTNSKIRTHKPMENQEFIPIQIKANREGFVLLPEESASFGEVFAYLKNRLENSRDFFRFTRMVLDLRFTLLSIDEIQSIDHLLKESCGAGLVEIKLKEGFSLFTERREKAAAPPAPSREVEAVPLIVRHTCRSGARIVSQSDCLVLGDVNPGAEVIAYGDVVVFGSLRGLAHAGAAGNRQARIWALSMEPNQLRIADMVAVPPRGRKPVPKRYEVAEVRGESIEVLTV